MNHRHSLVAALASLILFCLLVPASSGLTQSGPIDEPFDLLILSLAPPIQARAELVPYPGGDDVPPSYDPATLPECGEEYRHITAEMTQIDGPIDYTALPVCRLKISEITDPPPIPENVDPQLLSLAPPQPEHVRKLSGDVAPAAVDASVKTWAIQQFECLTACDANNKYVWSLYWMSSAHTPHWPSIAAYQLDKYTVAQRGHLGSNAPLFCEYSNLNGQVNTTHNVSLGHLFGYSIDFIELAEMRIFYETFLGPQCDFYATEHWVDADASMYYNLYVTETTVPAVGYNYTGRIYVNGNWLHVFTEYGYFPADYVDVGHEYTAHEGDIGTIEIPMNSVEKIRAKLDTTIYPMNKKVLPSWVDLSDLTHDFDSPWEVFDESNESYSSVAAEANGGN